jgi:adenylate kinase
MFGPPGAGKGTQGTTLAARLGVPHLSTGDMLRDVSTTGTELGREVARAMDGGELVPDAMMIGLVSERISRSDCRSGFVLDGFPRTVFQAGELERILADAGTPLSHVVALDVDPHELVVRLAGRRTCSGCNRPWSRPDAERAGGRCAACGGTLVQRADDSEEAVARRLEVYAAQTRELVDWYERKGLLRRVAGSGGRAEVAGRIDAAVGIPGTAQ